MKGGRPLFARVPTNRGGVYFCTTTPDPADSSLAANGIVLYVFVQRVLAAGAASLGRTRQLVAGDAAEQPATWKQLAGPSDALSTDYAHHAGVYAAGEKPIPGISSERLARAIADHGHGAVRYVRDRAELAAELARLARPGDVVIALGAGDVNKVLAPVAADIRARAGKGTS